MTPALSVVIPTVGRLPVLRRALDAYERQRGGAGFEVVVVDDGSADGTWEYLSGLKPERFSLLALRQEKEGPAAARNRGVAAARGDYVLLAGDDIVPTEGFVEAHRAAHASPRATEVALGRTVWHPEEPANAVMRHVDGIGAQQFHYAYLRDGERLGFKYLYSSNVSLRRSALERLGRPFDPDYSLAAFEDADLGYRLMGARREITYRRDVLAYHVHPHTLRSFARRQYRAGAMAAVFFRKHPEVRGEFRLEEVARAVERADHGNGAGALGAEKSEERLLEAFSPYADASGDAPRWLDPLLIGLFRYFYEKGLAEHRFGVAAGAALDTLMALQIEWPLGAALRERACALSVEDRARLEGLLRRWRGRHRAAGAAVSKAAWRLSLLARAAWFRLHDSA